MKKLFITILLLSSAAELYSGCGCSVTSSSSVASANRARALAEARAKTSGKGALNAPLPHVLANAEQILRHLVLSQSLVSKLNTTNVPDRQRRTIRQQKEIFSKINSALLVKLLRDQKLAK